MEELKLISGEDLQKKEVDPLKWIIKDLLPEGLTILAGSPKHGKSLLALNMAIAISSGNLLMNKFETSAGKILYIPYEDGERRFQKRLNDICRGYALDKAPKDLLIPENLYFPELDNQSIGLLDRLIEKNNLQLAVIDTLGSAMPGGNISQNYNYHFDYQMMKKFQQLANRNRFSLIMVHHTRKMKSDENVFNKISGTTGITGASDVNMVLQKNVLESVLYIQGRDLEDKVIKMNLSKENFTYRFEGEGEVQRTSPERKTIQNIFKEYSAREMKVEEVVEKSGKSSEAIRQLISSMRRDGQLIDGSQRGYYKLPEAN
jgi:RecA-family ATPase